MLNRLASSVAEVPRIQKILSWIKHATTVTTFQVAALLGASEGQSDEVKKLTDIMSQQKSEEVIPQMGDRVFTKRHVASTVLGKRHDVETILLLLKTQHSKEDLEIARRAELIRKKNADVWVKIFEPKYEFKDLPANKKLPWMFYPPGVRFHGEFEFFEGVGYVDPKNYLQRAVNEEGVKATGDPDWPDWKAATKLVLRDLKREDIYRALATADPDAYMKSRIPWYIDLIQKKKDAEKKYREDVERYRHQHQFQPWEIPVPRRGAPFPRFEVEKMRR